jgi:hypothetical protein
MPDDNSQKIHDLIAAIKRYDFECQGGPLRNCVQWRELQRLLGVEPDPLPSERQRAALE